MYYLLFLPLFVIFYLLFVLKNKNTDISRLMVLNKALNSDLEEYKVAQSNLISNLKDLEVITEETKNQLESILSSSDIQNYKVGSIVKWTNKKGEELSGMVYDDFTSNNVQFVVVRGMKEGDLTGRYFTILADKLIK
jgi:DNA-binding MltR family transcriptional regulator